MVYPSTVALPNELVTTIFELLDTVDLAKVNIGSHRFRAVSERLLYSKIHITDNVSQGQQPNRTIRWSETMLAHPHLAEYVKDLHIYWQGAESNSKGSPMRLFYDGASVFSHALSRLVFLESLEMYNIGTPIHHYSTYLPSLISCTMGGMSSSDAAQFLSCTPSLQHLSLPGLRSFIPLDPEALPELQSFLGSIESAACVLPYRPVLSATLTGHMPYVGFGELFAKMGYSSGPLRHVDLSAIAVAPQVIREISINLKDLEVLEIKLALRHTLHYAMSGIRLLAGLSPVLGAFPRLSELDLSSTGVDGVGRANAEEEQALCSEWGRACPSLRRIDFPSSTRWTARHGITWHPTGRVDPPLASFRSSLTYVPFPFA